MGKQKGSGVITLKEEQFSKESEKIISKKDTELKLG